jgi:hypothetical protein
MSDRYAERSYEGHKRLERSNRIRFFEGFR